MAHAKGVPGDEIFVLLDGEPFLTVIDDHGVQRFPQNDLLRYLVTSKIVDLNDLALAFHHDQFDADGYKAFYRDIGYSVSGYDEIFGPGSSWEDNGNEAVEIINPVWLEDSE